MDNSNQFQGAPRGQKEMKNDPASTPENAREFQQLKSEIGHKENPDGNDLERIHSLIQKVGQTLHGSREIGGGANIVHSSPMLQSLLHMYHFVDRRIRDKQMG